MGGSPQKWTDAQLAAALRDSRNISEAARRLGKFPSGAATMLLLHHAHRLGLSDLPLVVATRQRQGTRARGPRPCDFCDCDRRRLPRGWCLIHQRQLDDKGYLTPIRPWRHGATLEVEVRLAVSLLRHHQPELLTEALRPPAPLHPALVLLPRAG